MFHSGGPQKVYNFLFTITRQTQYEHEQMTIEALIVIGVIMGSC